jgi:hypothetical protein
LTIGSTDSGMVGRSKLAWSPLTRHITAILLVKVLALALIYAICFAPAHQPIMTDRTVAKALLGSGLRQPSEPAP